MANNNNNSSIALKQRRFRRKHLYRTAGLANYLQLTFFGKRRGDNRTFGVPTALLIALGPRSSLQSAFVIMYIPTYLRITIREERVAAIGQMRIYCGERRGGTRGFSRGGEVQSAFPGPAGPTTVYNK